MIIIYINCSLFPFISWIISGRKLYETRNKNTLKRFIGKRVYLAETGKGKAPVIRCSVVITELKTITTKTEYNTMRKAAMIKKGSCFDWNAKTLKKCFYKLENIQACKPFPMPENAVRHGRIYATLDNMEG